MKPSEQIEYKDSNGNPCTLNKLVRMEPDWAVSRINYSVDRIADLESKLSEYKKEIADQHEVIFDLQQERDALREAVVNAHYWLKQFPANDAHPSTHAMRFLKNALAATKENE